MPRQARLPGCLLPSAGLSDPRNHSPAPRGASSVPACQTRHRSLQPSKPQAPKFPFENLHLWGTLVQFPNPDPSTPGSGDREGPRCARAPGAGRLEAGRRGALTCCCGFGSSYLPGVRLPRCSWQGRGALRGFGADRLRRELRRAQLPKPAARSLSPLILREKRKRLVGAATPGGVGRGRRGESGPSGSGESCGAPARATRVPAHITGVPLPRPVRSPLAA